MIKATTTPTVAPAATNTKVHWHTIEFSHNTRTHTTTHTTTGAPACAASRNPNTTTSQTQTRATTGKQQTVKESPPQPPTQPTTGYKSFQLPGGCLGDDKEHYTPHPHTTNPQHTTTKHTNKPPQQTSSIAKEHRHGSPSEATVGNKNSESMG